MILAAITLSLQITRSTLDVLDGVNVEVAAHNTGNAPVSLRFSRPEEYEIDVLRGTHVIFSTLRPLPANITFPPHRRTLQPGPTVLAIYDWNTIENDGSTPRAGTYTVRATLLAEGSSPQAQTMVRFVAPTPIVALAKLKPGDEVTIAGTLDAAKQELTDETGSVALGRKLAAAPGATIAVRGYIMKRPDGSSLFYVERWAPFAP